MAARVNPISVIDVSISSSDDYAHVSKTLRDLMARFENPFTSASAARQGANGAGRNRLWEHVLPSGKFDSNGYASSREVADFLRRHADTVIDGHSLTRLGKSTQGVRWQFKPLEGHP